MPVNESLPFERDVWEEIAETYGTPVFVYDEAGIRASAQEVNSAFSWNPYHINYFAVKATPTPEILRIVESEAMGFDCSSLTELTLMDRFNLGYGHGIFYSSNNTPDSDYRFAAQELNATINVDKLPYVAQVQRALGGSLPERMAIRYNPGGDHGNAIIGKPEESKFGDTEEHVLEALKQMREGGVDLLGLHAMVVSNEREPEKFAHTAWLLRQVIEKADDQGTPVSFVNIGGGMGVRYNPATEAPVDAKAIGEAVRSQLGDLEMTVLTENGRFVTGPHGYLLTRITHGIIESHRKYLQIDTSINNMARLATVSAAFHVIDVLGREGDPTEPMDVVGSLCANTDRMFKDKELPVTSQAGDLMIVRDAGAHSRANSHNYNGRLRAGEVVVRPDGSHELIRRHETPADVLATVTGL